MLIIKKVITWKDFKNIMASLSFKKINYIQNIEYASFYIRLNIFFINFKNGIIYSVFNIRNRSGIPWGSDKGHNYHTSKLRIMFWGL